MKETAIPTLLSFGLTRKEAEIYEALLGLGNCPMSDLIKATSTHPQIAYSTINSLARKGLAIVTIENNRKYIRAENPEVLEDLESQRLEEVKRAIPLMKSLQAPAKEELVQTSRGKEAVRRLRRRAIDELPERGTYYVIGAENKAFKEAMGAQMLESERKRIRKGICLRIICTENHRSQIQKAGGHEDLAEYRFIPGKSLPSTTLIFNQTVGIQIWGREPVVLAMDSSEISASYVHYFETLWAIGKK